MNEQHRILAQHAIWAIQQTPAERWKHHGFGLLQLVLTPAHRLNLWAPELRIVDGDHGSWHTHRARIHATVLAGLVFNTQTTTPHHEWLFARRDGTRPQRLVDVWQVPNGAGALLPGPFRRVATDQRIGYRTTEHGGGGSYVVERGDGHCTESGPLGAVTSALVMDMDDEPATVFVAPGVRPARAFADRCSEATINAVRDRCVALLIDALASSADLDLTQRNAVRWVHGDRGLFMPGPSTFDQLTLMGLIEFLTGPAEMAKAHHAALLARGWVQLTPVGLAVLDKIGQRG